MVLYKHYNEISTSFVLSFFLSFFFATLRLFVLKFPRIIPSDYMNQLAILPLTGSKGHLRLPTQILPTRAQAELL